MKDYKRALKRWKQSVQQNPGKSKGSKPETPKGKKAEPSKAETAKSKLVKTPPQPNSRKRLSEEHAAPLKKETDSKRSTTGDARTPPSKRTKTDYDEILARVLARGVDIDSGTTNFPPTL